MTNLLVINKKIRTLIALIKIRSVLIIVSGLTVLLFQNCGGVNFSSPSVAASNNAQGGGTGGTTPPDTKPPVVCIPKATDTPIITTLPAGITQAMVQAICPAVGHDSECGVIIIVTDLGESLYFTGQGPYDGADDTLVGVINNSSKPVSSINLASTQDILNFDNDGLDTYTITGTKTKVGGNSMDTSTYGGPNAYYTNINSAGTAGTVDFITPVAVGGGTTFFSLEEALTSTNSCLVTTTN